MFEHLEVFLHQGTSTDVVRKEITFEDRGGQRFSLRPEGRRYGNWFFASLWLVSYLKPLLI
jgi:hypothetical protein